MSVLASESKLLEHTRTKQPPEAAIDARQRDYRAPELENAVMFGGSSRDAFGCAGAASKTVLDYGVQPVEQYRDQICASLDSVEP